MSYDPKDYHFDARSVGSGWLLVALIFCCIGIMSLDMRETMQAGWTAMAGDAPYGAVLPCT